MRNVVIFDDQRCIECICQGHFIFKYSILDGVRAGIDRAALERLGTTSNILYIFLTFRVLQKPCRGNNCNNGDFIKHVFSVYILLLLLQ